MAKKKDKLSLEELLEQALVKDEDKPHEVPGNWVWTKAHFIFEQVREQINPRSYKSLTYIGLENMRKDGGIDSVATTEDLKSNKVSFKSGDILYGKLRPYLNKHVVVPFDGVSSTDIVVFRQKGPMISQLFDFYLNLPQVITYAVKNSKGINLPRISPDDLGILPTPVPPLPEQQRIVDRIEAFFEKLDRAKELAQNALDSFENRKSAILHKAFTGELTRKWRKKNYVNLDGWREYAIKNLVLNLNQGWSPKCESFPSVDYRSWGVIKTTAIQHMQFIEEENKQLPISLVPKVQHELHTGDILITRAGPRIRVGVCCLIKQVRPRLLLCDKAYRFRVNEKLVIPDFIVFALNSPKILDEINAMKTGISDSGVNLTQDGFLRIKLNIPPLAEQEEIVRILDNLLETEQKAKELCNVIDKIDHMKKAILARAFRGELGTNNPEEESAIELLKEVLQEKAN